MFLVCCNGFSVNCFHESGLAGVIVENTLNIASSDQDVVNECHDSCLDAVLGLCRSVLASGLAFWGSAVVAAENCPILSSCAQATAAATSTPSRSPEIQSLLQATQP